MFKHITKGRYTKFISSNNSILQASPTNYVSLKLKEINLSVNDIPIKGALEMLCNLETGTLH